MRHYAIYVWIPLIVIAIAVLPFLARSILGPISRAAGRLKAPTRFQLSDFAWLLVKLQATLAICVQFIGLEARDGFVIILGFLIFAVSALWVGAVSFLSSAGITEPIRRAVFILIVLPATLAYLIGIPAAFFGASFTVLNWASNMGWSNRPVSWYEVAVAVAMGVAALVAFAIIGWTLRGLSFWVASASNLELEESRRQGLSSFWVR